MKRAPYKWLRIYDTMFSTIDSAVNTNDGVNVEMQTAFIDITKLAHLLQLFRVDDCLYYMNEGIGHNAIFNNITITGYNYGGLNRLMLFNKPYNVTFTNSKIIDAQWGFERYGIIGVVGLVSCSKYFFNRDLFENNTFVNTKAPFSTHLPIQVFMDYPNVQEQYEVVFRNNWYANQSFGGLGLIYVYKADVARLKVIFKDNTFENISNSVIDFPAIQFIAEQVEFSNLTIRNSQLSTGLQLTALLGVVKDLTLSNL